MAATILNGKQIAEEILADVVREVRDLPSRPCLAVVLVGKDPASMVYVQKKQEACKKVGIKTVEYQMPADISQDKLHLTIRDLNINRDVHGILVQLPLPPHMDKFAVFDMITPPKDVDVFTSYNTGLMIQNRPRFQPCTPQAVREILVRSKIPICGQNVVIVNRSLVVGQPLAHMLMQNEDFANATVTVCHEYTKNIKEVTKRADIVVTAVGRRDRFTLTADMVRDGATVIDVAIIRDGKKIIGDVDFEHVKEVAGHITPVPGGVGPCTVAMLIRNTVLAAKLQMRK
jgi:methylenetetrahydrofolate dehydrogenase (NADP+)/methenyltetrahydrofolate cyclohydrolase